MICSSIEVIALYDHVSLASFDSDLSDLSSMITDVNMNVDVKKICVDVMSLNCSDLLVEFQLHDKILNFCIMIH